MADIFGVDLGIDPTAWFSGGSFAGMITILLAIFVFFLAAAIGIWVWYQSKLFNKTINDFENIGGAGFQFVGRDKARLIKVGDGGEEILYLKKRKEYRTAYGRKMGNNVYWFAKGQDGYFYNVVLGDLDAKQAMLDIEPIDRDMRYMHVAIRKNIDKRYNKQTFMDKYGSWIMGGITFIIFFIGMGFLLNQIGNLMQEATAVASATQQAADALKSAVGQLDTICSGGSGIR